MYYIIYIPSGKLLACKADSLVFVKSSSVPLVEAEEENDKDKSKSKSQSQLERAVRLLGLTPEELELTMLLLPPTTTDTAAPLSGATAAESGARSGVEQRWGVGGDTPTEKVGMALRACLRDVGSAVSSASMRENLREAAALLFTVTATAISGSAAGAGATRGSVTGEVGAVAPEVLVRSGALGSRAAAALVRHRTASSFCLETDLSILLS
jgi:hypothetical protein